MRQPLILTAIAAGLFAGACNSEPGVRDEETPVLPEHASASPDRVGVAGNAEAEADRISATGPEGDPIDVCGAPLDTNQDGIVQLAEYNSFSGFAFDNWNVNRDEAVSSAEFHSCWRALGWGESQTAFRAFDDDGNGLLDEEEFFEQDEFELWDSDGNSGLSRSELT